MKKTKLFVSIILIGLFSSIRLNAQYFNNGDNILSAGLGLGSSLVGAGYSSSPAISLEYEHGNWDVGGPGVISLGGYLGFQSFRHEGFGYLEKENYTVIGIRSAYHFNMINAKDFDVYAGLMLSYDIDSYSSNFPYWYGYSESPSGIGFSVYVG